jgi:hypothetical protein
MNETGWEETPSQFFVYPIARAALRGGDFRMEQQERRSEYSDYSHDQNARKPCASKRGSSLPEAGTTAIPGLPD